ncbi:MAG: hypothetical protein BZ138_04445 [Methanosphaera sp. rholeuAM270]|nr:MAG: hypothetical protein BZ138_04445 [Methanosphaera sp. rholeuAM270]
MLEFKRISDDSVAVMRDAVGSDVDYYSRAVESISNLVPSRDVHILNSANSCLLCLCECIPDPVLVCDMGGWNGFIRSCEIFGKNVEYIATDDGLINIEVLDNYLNEHDIKSLYITSLAGYTAAQPLDQIHELCNIHEVLLIIDISPTVGNTKISQYGDIQVASTGSPKIINIENGGFICNITGKINPNKHMLKSLKADNITCAGIANEIGKSTETLLKTMEINRYLKEKLIKNNIKTIHPKHYGLNTIIPVQSKSKAKKLAYNIRKELKINGNIIGTGPNYNRIKKPCITIETKNLNINTISMDDLDYLYKTIIREKKKIETE